MGNPQLRWRRAVIKSSCHHNPANWRHNNIGPRETLHVMSAEIPLYAHKSEDLIRYNGDNNDASLSLPSVARRQRPCRLHKTAGHHQNKKPRKISWQTSMRPTSSWKQLQLSRKDARSC